MRNQGTATFISGHGSLWEFPLTASYYVGDRRIRPYLGAGIVLSHDLSGKEDLKITDQSTGAVTSISGPLGPFQPNWPSFVVDAGIEWSRSRLRLRPELRYTRHRLDPFGVLLRSDQFDLLLNVSLQKR